VTVVTATVTGHVCPIVDVDGTDKHFGDTVELDSDVTAIQALIDGGHITVP
jgi:hypothetical protein